VSNLGSSFRPRCCGKAFIDYGHRGLRRSDLNGALRRV
jgi:hypothetical protein